MLHNIFQPLLEVSLDPASNAPLHYFLETIVGFDSVDDESRPEYGQLSSSSSSSIPLPEDWYESSITADYFLHNIKI